MREIERIIGEALGEASVEFMSREERGVDIVMPTEVLAVIRDKTVKEIQSQIQQREDRLIKGIKVLFELGVYSITEKQIDDLIKE